MENVPLLQLFLMNNFETFQAGQMPVAETGKINFTELKTKLGEWIAAADGDMEEIVRRRDRIDSKRESLLDLYKGDCRKYKTFYLLSSNGETAPDSAEFDDFPGSEVSTFINSL